MIFGVEVVLFGGIAVDSLMFRSMYRSLVEKPVTLRPSFELSAYAAFKGKHFGRHSVA